MKKFLDNLCFFGGLAFYAFLAFVGLMVSLFAALFITPFVLGFLSLVVWYDRRGKRKRYNRYLKNKQEQESQC